MDETGIFLSEVIPQLRREVAALQGGDAGPRKELWSHRDPVSLFGAELSGSGWSDIEPVFDQVAASFTGSQACDYEVVAAGVSGDLGYIAAIERCVASSGGGEPRLFALRVTTVLRREDGAWKVVHRHGDPADATARAYLAARRSGEG